MKEALIVDASASDLRRISALLVKTGFDPLIADSMDTAKEMVRELPPGGVIVSGLTFRGGSAVELINWLKSENYVFPVIAIMDRMDPLAIYEVMKGHGAIEIIQRPALDKQLVEMVGKYFRDTYSVTSDEVLIHRPSREFQRIESEITRIATTDANVIILGESGMGKEQIAREIFRQSNRTDKPLIVIEAGGAALVGVHKPDSEKSEMYNRIGSYFKKAAGGTIIIKNVHLLNFDKQSVVLHILNSDHPDVRVICTAEPELLELVSNKTFRSNLFFNLREMDITVKPLRKVTEDVLPVAEFYLAQYAEEHNEPVKRLDTLAVKTLKQHDWPGNIRELKNVILLAARNVEEDVITYSDLPISRSSPATKDSLRIRDSNVERQQIIEALKKTGGNKTQAASLLGIDRSTLRYKMVNHGLK